MFAYAVEEPRRKCAISAMAPALQIVPGAWEKDRYFVLTVTERGDIGPTAHIMTVRAASGVTDPVQLTIVITEE